MKKNKLRSAKFKKDIMVYLAVTLFLLIVAGEIFLAVFIPLHLNWDGVWLPQRARQNLFANFDQQRRMIQHGTDNNSFNEIRRAEFLILEHVYDHLAAYLHNNGRNLSVEQSAAVTKRIGALFPHIVYLRDRGEYSSRVELKLPARLIKK